MIIAGGPSVRQINLTELLPCRFIGVNAVNVLESFRPLSLHFAAGIILDEPLLRRHLRELVRGVSYPIFTGNTPHDTDMLLAYLNDLGIHRIPTTHTEGLGDSFSRFSNGGNSGFAAVQLAVIMGFTTIGLLGIDGRAGGTKRRFHDMYPAGSTDNSTLDEWCMLLDACAPLFDVLSIDVWNLSKSSSLRKYKTISPEEWRVAVRSSRASTGERTWPVHAEPITLPFRAQPLDVQRIAIGSCYSGARNAVDPERYCPVPSSVEDRVKRSEHGAVLMPSDSSRGDMDCRPRSDAASIRAGQLSLHEKAPAVVEDVLGQMVGALHLSGRIVDMKHWDQEDAASVEIGTCIVTRNTAYHPPSTSSRSHAFCFPSWRSSSSRLARRRSSSNG